MDQSMLMYFGSKKIYGMGMVSQSKIKEDFRDQRTLTKVITFTSSKHISEWSSNPRPLGFKTCLFTTNQTFRVNVNVFN
jgi:hypothetical protein